MKAQRFISVFLFAVLAGAVAAKPADHPGQAHPHTAKPAAARGANPALGAAPDTSKPINVDADTFFADLKANIGIYTGHVVVTQDTFRLRADEVKVFTDSGRPSRLESRGNVVFVSPSGTATGEFGTYNVATRIVTLTGKDVVLVRDKNVMHGTKLEVTLATGEAHLFAPGGRGGRVQGLFVPPPKPATAPAAGAVPSGAGTGSGGPAPATQGSGPGATSGNTPPGGGNP